MRSQTLGAVVAARIEPSWAQARQIAHASAHAIGSERVPLAMADGRMLAADVVAATCLPPFRAAAMDGWAVAGAGPWAVVGEQLAGGLHSGVLACGQAVRIATGAAVPRGATAVLRTERGQASGGLLTGAVAADDDLRPTGEEAVAGQVVLCAGTPLTPAHLGLAAACGVDTLLVTRRATARVLVFGDELLRSGPARDGRVRDSLGPQLPGWLARLGVDTSDVVYVADTLADHVAALRAATAADLVVTTGGTAAGPVDFLHEALGGTGGSLLVDGVAVRPGHPMMLGRWDGQRWLLGLPGNPQSAVVALLTLGAPLIAGLYGLALPALGNAALATDVDAPKGDTRLVASTLADGVATPTLHIGSGMLRGLAAASGFAVVPASGAGMGQTVDWLPLPGHSMF